MTRRPDLSDWIIRFDGRRPLHQSVAYLIGQGFAHDYLRLGFGGGCVVVGDGGTDYRWYYLAPDQATFVQPLQAILLRPEQLDAIDRFIANTRNEALPELRGAKITEASPNQLHNLLRTYYSSLQKLFYVSGSLRRLDQVLIPALQALTRSPEQRDETVALLAVTAEETVSTQEERALLGLAARMERERLDIQDEAVRRSIDDLVRQYSWLGVGYHSEPAKTAADYQVVLERLVRESPNDQLIKIDERRRLDLERRQTLVAALDEQGRQLAMIAQRVTTLKDHFRAAASQIIAAAEPVFAMIASSTGRDQRWLRDLLPEEMTVLLRGDQPDETAIARRAAPHVSFALDQSFETVFGADAERLIEQHFTEQHFTLESSVADQWQGRAASPGYGKGYAKIVRSPADLAKVEKGDILVVTNTTPELVPAMRNAAAIVAEEGGITAHVSVVSRELGIPTIVGIPQITHTLRDGDQVEVDANIGRVHRLT